MKKLAIIAAAAIATSAFAFGSSTPSPEIKITGASTQNTTTSAFSTVANSAEEDAYAVQNLSSNAGNVTIGGNSSQTTSLGGFAMVKNTADGHDAYAAQNLASNSGLVGITGFSTQMVSVGGLVSNTAKAHSTAVQNLSSNNGCSACQPADGKKPGWSWD